jgi:hypothetical protein
MIFSSEAGMSGTSFLMGVGFASTCSLASSVEVVAWNGRLPVSISLKMIPRE